MEKKRPDGSVVPCILTATPFTGPDGTLDGIVESFKDITELAKAKETIRKKRDKLQGILSHMKEGVSIVNLNHEIEFQNIAHKKFIGEKKGNPLLQGISRPRYAPCDALPDAGVP